ncbi:DUF4352 domain-containing protein [Caldibacillus lycopersici]|uniref:DUF4352 domain-containing protein n=1 Tax=Perspicuibacillus lycopersici TaxID=1325689 RepID=A0AAE3LRH9_9BACI|nr:DUF4352 domain-containing protein [Perspicuibacillus lycopersici]MCU9614679.1 DUF4352 domain-containing protein [Perspicuibacillus lycopersici]
MKYRIRAIFVSLLVISLLTGCSFASTSNVAIEKSVQLDNNNDENTDKENNDGNGKGNENSSEVNTLASIAVADISQSSLAIGEEQDVNGLTIKVTNIREIADDYIKASKDKFIGVEVEITNNREEAIEITSLPQLSLIAADAKQDIALIDTKGTVDQTISPGKSIVGEIAFDSVTSDQYIFMFAESKDANILSWSFTDEDIKK